MHVSRNGPPVLSLFMSWNAGVGALCAGPLTSHPAQLGPNRLAMHLEYAKITKSFEVEELDGTVSVCKARACFVQLQPFGG